MFTRVASLLTLVLLIGCSSTSIATKESVNLPRTLRLSENYHPEVAPFVGDFLQPIVKKGFSIGYTEDPNAAAISVEFDPNVFHTEIKFKVTQNGKVIVSSEASNSGWGTGIARNSALAKLAANVTTNLDKELQSLKVTITEDKTPSVDFCDQIFAKNDFSLISKKISINLEPSSDLKLLLLQEKPNEDEKKQLITWNSVSQECANESNKIRQMNGASTDWISVSKSIFVNTQIQLAKLINGQISYGDFQKERITFFDQAKNQWLDSESKRMAQQAEKEREGKQITNTVQSNMISSQSLMLQTQQNSAQQINNSIPRATTYKPISCYRIGNSVNCY
jgi:hypothetical protein